MYIAQLDFKLQNNKDIESAKEVIDSLLGSFRTNGQILGREFPIATIKLGYKCFVMVPEVTSLNDEIANKYVRQDLTRLNDIGIQLSHKIIGEEAKSSHVCKCSSIESYILFTDHLSLESPLRCGKCFGVIPLYKIPPTYDEEYYDIISWQSDYRSCDRLQMNCKTGERFGTYQISRYEVLLVA